MPQPNPDKVQLNVFVHRDVADAFRARAKAAGYGKQPSPYFEEMVRSLTKPLELGDVVKLLRQRQAPLSPQERAQAEVIVACLQVLLAPSAWPPSPIRIPCGARRSRPR